MASCVRNIRTKNYQNMVIGFYFTVKNVGDVFVRHSVYPLKKVNQGSHASWKVMESPGIFFLKKSGNPGERRVTGSACFFVRLSVCLFAHLPLSVCANVSLQLLTQNVMDFDEIKLCSWL